MASPFFWGIMFFFNALQSIMFGYLEVFSRKKFFSQNLLPLCHQPSETTVFQTYSVGGSKVGGGSKAPNQPHPQPLPEREGSGCAQ